MAKTGSESGAPPHATHARARRVGEAVREQLALLLVGEVKDPGAAGAVVTRVEMTGDLRCARVYVRALDSPATGAVLQALDRASGMLRREVARRLGLRHAPELRFVHDEGPEGAMRIEQILAEIEADRRR